MNKNNNNNNKANGRPARALHEVTQASNILDIGILSVLYSVIHQYLFMADTIFEHLKYQLDQK
jgi:hypothetical protein